MKMNKRAWLRIVEAFIGVLIIMGVVLFIISNQIPKTDISESVYELQKNILNVVRDDNTLRNEILIAIPTVEIEKNNPGYVLDNFILNRIPSSWDFVVVICEIDAICNSGKTPNDREVYATETIITSDLTRYNPKKLRFFVWIK